MSNDGIFKYVALAAVAGVGIYAVSKWLGSREEVVTARQDAITTRTEIRQESRTERVRERWDGINEAIDRILDGRSKKSSGSSYKPAPVVKLTGSSPSVSPTVTAKNYLQEAANAAKRAAGSPLKAPNTYTPSGVRAVPSFNSPAAILSSGILKIKGMR